MGAFSVILNLITLLTISVMLYIGYTIYRTRPDKSMTAGEVFNTMLVDPDTITHAYMTDTKLGPIGDFSSYEWESKLESSSVSE